MTAAFILGPEHFGRQMHNGLDPATRWDIVWHEPLGLAVVVLTLLRLLWTAVRPAAPKFIMADWGEVHQFLGDAIVWLASLHAVAAIWHHAAGKDGVLRAMLPRRG